MRTYDAIFILDEKKLEDGGEGFAKDVASHIKTIGGTLKEKIALGRKTFARPIGKTTAGVYWEFIVDLDPANVPLFEDKYRLNTTLLRMKVFHYLPIPASGRKLTLDSVPGMVPDDL